MTRLEGRVLALAVLASGVVGCGGGSPLLHPARVLPQGEVRGAAGFSYAAALGNLQSSLANAKNQSNSGVELPGTPGSNESYAQGALVAASVAPGSAPYAGARVGIGEGWEGGLVYTGRGARIDVRHGFRLSPRVDLSVGLGGTGAFYGRTPGGTQLRAVDLSSLRGAGADLPVIIGYESEGGLYRVWGGVRGGFEHDVVETVSTEERPPNFSYPVTRLEGDRFNVGGVAGLAVGFRTLHVALELEADFVHVNGTYNDTKASVSGMSLTPAAALWVAF